MPVFDVGAKPGKGKFLDAYGHTIELQEGEALPRCPHCEPDHEEKWWRLS
ncbi:MULTISPECIES: hypothetical protein [Cellulomonas]|nr:MULTISPECIES: hypothetical protein [Cellulomonas]MCR6688083.1 hypothetical protein [Cellulomonas sp.]